MTRCVRLIPHNAAAPGARSSCSTAPLRFEAVEIAKSFGDRRAVGGVGLAVHDGEVLGLFGSPGSGKSTLLKVLSGVLPPDSGELRLDGSKVRPRTDREANELGVFRVFREPAPVDGLRVYEEMFFGWESLFRSRAGTIDHPAVRRAAEAALEHAGFDEIAVGQQFRSLGHAARRGVGLARVSALAQRLEIARPVVLFDEPERAVDGGHEQDFQLLLERMRGYATAVFVSCRASEILRTCSRVVVLHGGRKVAERSTENVGEDELQRLVHGGERIASSDRRGGRREASHRGAVRL